MTRSRLVADLGRLGLRAGGMRTALAAGIGVRGHVGQAESHLFPARELTGFAVSWIEDHFVTSGG